MPDVRSTCARCDRPIHARGDGAPWCHSDTLNLRCDLSEPRPPDVATPTLPVVYEVTARWFVAADTYAEAQEDARRQAPAGTKVTVRPPLMMLCDETEGARPMR